MQNKFFDGAYAVYSAFVDMRESVCVPSEYKSITEAIVKKLKWSTHVTGKKNEFSVPRVCENKKVFLALSGGLDSVYLLYRLKERGHEVTACHVEGLNKSSAKAEAGCAEKIARVAGVRFIRIRFSSPRQVFPDNPFKNQLILSMMLDTGIKRGVYRYAVGSDWGTPLSESVTGFTITDAAEVYSQFWHGVNDHFPQAELVFIPDEEKKYDRLRYLCQRHPDALRLVSSCVAPYRFREYWHARTEQKFGVKLMPGRCGACYKCAMEYILLTEAGLIPRAEQYFLHCLHILATSKTAHRKDLFAETLPVATRIENLKNYGS